MFGGGWGWGVEKQGGECTSGAALARGLPCSFTQKYEKVIENKQNIPWTCLKLSKNYL